MVIAVVIAFCAGVIICLCWPFIWPAIVAAGKAVLVGLAAFFGSLAGAVDAPSPPTKAPTAVVRTAPPQPAPCDCQQPRFGPAQRVVVPEDEFRDAELVWQ